MQNCNLLNFAELQKSFSLRDYNKEGVVYAQDVPAVIRSVNGLKPSEDEIQSIVSEVNKSGSRQTNCKVHVF